MSRPSETVPAELPDRPPPYDLVVFDCDSTLCGLEGIEELARDNPEIARLTQAAMAGEVPLEEVYGRRLAHIRPSRADVEHIAQRYVDTLLPNAGALVAALLALGKRVGIVSGGLLPAVLAVGRTLGVPDEMVRAVDLSFDGRGAYAGYEEDSPLARAGGKVHVLAALRRPGERLAFVGDGATDLEAAGEVDRFIAFGGVERRPAVLARARVRCLEPDFRALAPLLLSEEERQRLDAQESHRGLLRLPHTPRPPTA